MSATSVSLLEKLIAFDTVSRDSNLELIHFVHDYLNELGVASTLVYNDDRSKANLHAMIGPNTEGGVVLSGHTDVVPVDGQPWSTDPFVLTAKDQRLYGRGTCDMKAFLAVSLAKVPAMQQAALKRPIHLAFSYDEEIGCLGAPRLIEHIAQLQAKPQAVIIGEPTSMQAVVAHKGITALKTTVTGHEAHSSQVQRGASAVTLAARLVAFIDDMMQENAAKADAANGFVPPYTTLHTGVIQGGTAINIMARECSFIWDIRTLPGDPAQPYLDRLSEYGNKLLAPLRHLSEHIAIRHEILANVPPLADHGGSAQELVNQSLNQPQQNVVPFAAEGGQFQSAGFDVVLCGPGSIDQAHQPDEYIDIDQISQCEQFMDQLIQRLSN